MTGPIRITENSKASIQVNHSKNGEKIKGVQRAGGMRQGKPAGLQGQRSCHGNFGKLVRKVGNAVTFPIHIMPKNQSLSFD